VDLIKFGKRVNFGNKLTNVEVLEDHLRMIKMNKQMTRYDRENQIHNEREELKRLTDEIDSIAKNKHRTSEALRNEFLFFND